MIKIFLLLFTFLLVCESANATALTAKFQRELDSKTPTELVKVEALELYQNKDSYPPLLKMLENSKQFFYMNLLSFTCDQVTEKMVSLLETKAKALVDVRLIVNQGFSYLSMPCLKRLKKAGVKITKAKTHASYFINEQQELMIGSQSVARMFFLADGFNGLDRDMMIYAKGALATDAFKDFLSIWINQSKRPESQELKNDIQHLQTMLKNDYQKKIRGHALYARATMGPERLCRFVSLETENFWNEITKINQKQLYFSGVNVEIGDIPVGRTLKEKSLKGMEVHYIGNGRLGGNGELTMVVVEWINDLKSSAFSFLTGLLERFNEWDKSRLERKNQEHYQELKKDANIRVWNYLNFVHYKVWLFDHPGFFIGSANLDESKMGKVSEAGIYCLDAKIHNQLQSVLLKDRSNSSEVK